MYDLTILLRFTSENTAYNQEHSFSFSLQVCRGGVHLSILLLTKRQTRSALLMAKHLDSIREYNARLVLQYIITVIFCSNAQCQPASQRSTGLQWNMGDIMVYKISRYVYSQGKPFVLKRSPLLAQTRSPSQLEYKALCPISKRLSIGLKGEEKVRTSNVTKE